jgi:hypothetical protein
VVEIKDKDLNPDSKNIGRRQIIDTSPTAIFSTAAIQPEEPADPKEGERLFSFTDVGEGDPTAFYC